MFAGAVVGLRFLVVPAWIAAALAVTWWLPGLGSGEPLPLGGLIPENAESAQVAQRDAEIFGVPLTTDTLVVQRNADGLSPAAQAKAVARALAVSRAPKQAEGIQLALPIANTLGLFPSSREHGTTAITYLYFGPEASLSDRVSEAEAYASQIPADDAPVGVTGPAPARDQQFREMEDALPIVEAGTVLVILLVVGLTFQAFGAPLLTLFAAAISFLVARGLIPWVGTRLGVEIPQEVEPLVVALTLGIVTDYAVFYLSGMRRSLLEGRSAVESALDGDDSRDADRRDRRADRRRGNRVAPRRRARLLPRLRPRPRHDRRGRPRGLDHAHPGDARHPRPPRLLARLRRGRPGGSLRVAHAGIVRPLRFFRARSHS